MKEIIIQGTPHPIHFGLRAIDEFVRQRGAEFGQTVASTNALGSLDSIVALTATGLNEGARRAGSDRRYTEDEVWDIFDEEPSLILAVSELFVESIAPLTDKLGDLSKTGNARRRGAASGNLRAVVRHRRRADGTGARSLRTPDARRVHLRVARLGETRGR